MRRNQVEALSNKVIEEVNQVDSNPNQNTSTCLNLPVHLVLPAVSMVARWRHDGARWWLLVGAVNLMVPASYSRSRLLVSGSVIFNFTDNLIAQNRPNGVTTHE